MILRISPNPSRGVFDRLGMIAAQQALYYGEPVAHIEAFYKNRLTEK